MQIPEERYNALMSRYNEFVESMGNPDIAPVKVFDALSQKQNEELLLIREISAFLQKKKDDDIAKQNQTETEETAEKEETKEGSEEVTKEGSEEETKEGFEEETKEESEKQKSQ